jgi:hypothetical protein
LDESYSETSRLDLESSALDEKCENDRAGGCIGKSSAGGASSGVEVGEEILMGHYLAEYSL